MSRIRAITLLFFLLSALSLLCQSKNEYRNLKISLEQARESNNYKELAKAYFEIARYEETVSRNHHTAFEQVSRSLEYYELAKDSLGIAKCKYHIARQLLATGMTEDGYIRLEELKPYYERKKDTASLVRVDLQLFNFYFKKIETDSCSAVLNRLQDYFETHQEPALELDFLYKQISFNELLKDFPVALEYAELCVEKSNLSKNNEAKARCLKGRGQILALQGNNRMATYDFMASLNYLQPYRLSKEKLIVYKNIANSYRRSRNFEYADHYTGLYSELQDSILNENRIIALNDLTYKYESKEKASAIRLLEKDKQFVQQSIKQQKRALIILGLALGGLLLGIYYIIRFYTDKISAARIIESQNEKITRQRISELQDKIRMNSMQSMIAGQEVERERIAKDLHDSLGGLLSTIKLQVDNIKDGESNIERIQEFKHATSLLDVAVSEVRTISQDLQPGALKRLGLVSAINDLVNRYQSSNGPEITFQHFELPAEMEQGFALGIYRIVQEILNNAIKHAKASEIFVQLNMDEKDLVIHIEDDGIGFDPNRRYNSMGLENIKSRVNYLKGTMDIDSRINEGTSFIIHLDTRLVERKDAQQT